MNAMNPTSTTSRGPAPANASASGRAGWELVIGLECHVQLATRSKIFSGASTAFGAEPNTQACAVDLALPGSLPVMNRQAAECAIRFGLAVGAEVAQTSVFARKNYFYPDLPKGYQISQFERPVVSGGGIDIHVGEDHRRIALTRAHLEEDAGKSLHEDFHGLTGIDLNRAGTPLLEIVSEPEMRSAAEAVAYARALHALVVWLGICDGNLQEGSFRVDANVSVRPRGQQAFGTRCEIKNLNSFRFLERAIEHEAERQIEEIEQGRAIVQQTRLYDEVADETRAMRSKEDAHDYRYFPDPDLPPLIIESDWIDRVRASMPELPGALRERYASQYGLRTDEAAVVTSSRAAADTFAAIVAQLPESLARQAALWMSGELSARLNREGLEFDRLPVSPSIVAALITRVGDGTVSQKVARDLLDAAWNEAPASGGHVPSGQAGGDEGAEALRQIDAMIDARGLRQISDDSALIPIVDQVLAANAKSVAEFRAGKEKALNALVGQVMKSSAGKANPQQVMQLLRSRIDTAS